VNFAALLAALCAVESGGKTNAINLNEPGGRASYGECQVQLRTALGIGYRGHVSALWLEPAVSRRISAAYLRQQIERYDGKIRLAVSAYNAGTATSRNVTYVNRVLLRYYAQQFSEVPEHASGGADRVHVRRPDGDRLVHLRGRRLEGLWGK
jgi:soluble lytic murein transglycosylase-like protein